MTKSTGKKTTKATTTSGSNGEDVGVVPMSLRLQQPLYERLRKLAFDKRVPMSQFISRGVEMVLKAEKY